MKRIKNRIHGRVIAAVTIVAAFLFEAVPITAYAGGYDCSCDHKCTEGTVNCDCDLCNYDYRLCCAPDGTEVPTPEPTPEITPEVTPEPTEIPDGPEEEWGPLTPDGNMTLVDDYGAPEKSGKQFITVVTKSGNYFYIIIDRDDNGTETVHFLNMVDEADLLALMDEDAVKEYTASREAQETEPTVTEEPTLTDDPEPAEEPEKPEKAKTSSTLVIVLIVALGGGGAYLYFTKMKNKKPKQETTVDPDADYNEDEENYYAEALKEEVQEVMKAEEEAKAKRASEIDFDSESEEDPAEDEE